MADKNFKVKTGLSLPSPLPVDQGGTGQTSTTNTLNALLPLQTDNAGKVLKTDGTNTSWVAQAVAERLDAEEQARLDAEAKTAAKASALAKLTALGLTEEEAMAIVGA